MCKSRWFFWYGQMIRKKWAKWWNFIFTSSPPKSGGRWGNTYSSFGLHTERKWGLLRESKAEFWRICKDCRLNAKVLEKKSRRFNKKKYLYCNKIAKAVKTRHFLFTKQKKNRSKAETIKVNKILHDNRRNKK